MTYPLALAERLCGELALHGVGLDPRATLDRSDAMALRRPGRWSANRSCRLVRAADGWLAVNPARAADVELVPPWLGRTIAGDHWRAIVEEVRRMRVQDARDAAALLGPPVSIVGEAAPQLPTWLARYDDGPRRGARVIDLSSLWAGPLCAAILAAAGARVTKIESRARPDTIAVSTPLLNARLNGAKERLALDSPTWSIARA